MTWISDITELLWRGSWAVVPFAVVVAAVCRWAPCRPGTRHTLWVVLLAAFLAPLISLVAPLPELAPATAAELTFVSEDLKAIDESAPLESPEEPREYETTTPAFVVAPALCEEKYVARSDADSTSAGEAESYADAHWYGTPVADATRRTDEGAPQTWREPRTAAALRTARRVAVSNKGLSITSKTPNSLAITAGDVVDAQVAKQALPTKLAFSSDYGRRGGRPLRRDVDLVDELAAGAAHAPPTDKAEADAANFDSAGGRWYAALVDVRDALTRLPALPGAFWFTGAVGMALLYIGGALRFRGRLARSEAASKPVRRMVSRVSRKMGLRSTPETVMLDAPISPMIWLGRRVLLVLPSRLWAQLDDVGRQAILCHELAHLRRRDHWVRWLELLLSALLWWNPLIWWVRRRVHEEADLCCDLWVTWLMPRRRRAYAEALLAAREHIRDGGLSTPSVAMGAATSNARKFTRRITMVMTQNSRPGLSLAGIGLACTLAIAGWIATPALGGPPKKASTCTVTCGTPCQGKAAVVCKTDGSKGGCTGLAKTIEVTTNSDEDAQVYFITGDGEKKVQQYRRQKVGGDLAERLERLEQAVERLSEMMGQKSKKLDLRLPAMPAHPAPPAPPAPPRIWTNMGDKNIEFKVGDSDDLQGYFPGQDLKKTVVRTYNLPKGKLEALTELMVRQDVPIMVSPQGDGIEVHATPKQHKIFKAFVNMIHPEGAKHDKAVSRTHSRVITSDNDGAVIRLETSGDDENDDVRVIEIKDGKVYINGEETDENSGFGAYMLGEDVEMLGDGAHFYFADAMGQAQDEYFKALDEYGDVVDVLNDVQVIMPDVDFDVDCDVDGDQLSKMIRKQLEAKGVWSDEIGEKIQKQLGKQIKVIKLQADELEKQAKELEKQAQKIEVHVKEVPEL